MITFPPPLTRRDTLKTAACGFGSLALAGLMARPAGAAESPGGIVNPFAPRQPHFPARAKRVIFLFMNGGPSQVDSFDWKPELSKRHGEDLGGGRKYFQSPWPFSRHGRSGLPISSLFPHIAAHADDLCLINSMHTDVGNHPQAILQLNTGSFQFVRPSVGSWVVYGLGTENRNLPAYVVLGDPLGLPHNGTRNWTSGFLPPTFQGTTLRPTGSPILNLKPQFEQPSAVTEAARGLLERLDGIHRQERPHQPDLDARIESYGLAARMQLSASEALDLSRENPHTLESYGIGEKTTDSYGRRCLLARRLVERGVRFVQLFLEEQPWDSHVDLADNHRAVCERTDKPVAGLLRDLKQRGLLENTLVIWGGEFGRTPTSQKTGDLFTGRDHNMQAFSSWMAGGGVKGGFSYGQTDEFGHAVVEDPVSVHDFHATVLHLLGINHEKLFFPRSGLEERLTGIEPPRVVTELLA